MVNMQSQPLEGTVVTITGGTGSFGATMASHLLQRGVGRVNIFSRDEAKQDDMRRRFSDERLRFYLGDVRDAASVAPAMRDVDFVFHAAALKQVPSCEFFPQQAVKTNVVGSDLQVPIFHMEAGNRSPRPVLGVYWTAVTSCRTPPAVGMVRTSLLRTGRSTGAGQAMGLGIETWRGGRLLRRSRPCSPSC